MTSWKGKATVRRRRYLNTGELRWVQRSLGIHHWRLQTEFCPYEVSLITF